MSDQQSAGATTVEPPGVKDVLATFLDYNKSFLTMRPEMAAPFLHEPAIFISQQGAIVMTDEAQRLGVFAKIMQDLAARKYEYTQLKDLSIKLLGNGLALVSGDGYRFKTDGQELERYSLTYTLRRVGDDWKIISAIIHDIGTPPPYLCGDFSVQ